MMECKLWYLHASFSAVIKELTRSICSFLMPSSYQHCPHIRLLSLKPACNVRWVSATRGNRPYQSVCMQLASLVHSIGKSIGEHVHAVSIVQ